MTGDRVKVCPLGLGTEIAHYREVGRGQAATPLFRVTFSEYQPVGSGLRFWF